MADSLLDLMLVSKGPLGPSRSVDFGTNTGPLGELSAMLWQRNGFTVFNAGIQVFRAGADGLGPELAQWNAPDGWKEAYGPLAEDLFCFGHDLFGVQFAISSNQQVVAFDPENGRRTEIGSSLQEWAKWLLHDPEVRGAHGFATTWQDQHGPLEADQRLIPWQLFALGGDYDPSNRTLRATTCRDGTTSSRRASRPPAACSYSTGPPHPTTRRSTSTSPPGPTESVTTWQAWTPSPTMRWKAKTTTKF